MRGEAMKRVCARLQQMGEDLSSFCALEFFAREGDWQTAVYFPKVRSLDVWEIDPAFRPALERNLPGARITIGNSFELALRPENQGRFDFLVFDNPQGLYGPKSEYCEHFEALALVPHLMSQRAWVIFNVNWHPFNYEEKPDWKRRRERYYGTMDTGSLDMHRLAIWYREMFETMRLRNLLSFSERRNDEYLSYLALKLEK
ncbi:MAG: hypothetical protein HUU37_02700 [Bdellovibrionales bacterium]|nr:hypothetical protein [Bdellovibrionales bacterium]